MDYHGTNGDDILDQVRLGLPDWSTIYGGAGSDTITIGNCLAMGEAGVDTIVGTTSGATVLYWFSPNPVAIDLLSGKVQDGYGTVDTLVNIHYVHGSPNADTFLGSNGNDHFYGGSGDDYFDGRDGVDTVEFFFSPSSKFAISYDSKSGLVTVKNADLADGNYGTKTLKDIEVISFTGKGSDESRILVSLLIPGGAELVRGAFTVTAGTAVDNADASGNPRWANTDLNGDGRLDLALRFDPDSAFSSTKIGSSPIRFYLQAEDGSYTPVGLELTANVAPTLVNRIVAADFNGDGKGDIAIAASGQDPYADGKPLGPWPGELSYVLMSTDGPNYSSVAIQGMPKLFAHHLSVGDVNGDGSPDIYIDSIWSNAEAASYFLINDKHGGFKLDRSGLPFSIANPQSQVISTTNNGTTQVSNQNIYTSSAIFDANGDGYVDLAVLPLGGTTNGKVFLNDGKGQFSDTRVITLPVGPYGGGSTTWSSLEPANYVSVGSIYLDTVAFDVNGDGRQDLVSVVTKDQRDGSVYYYYRDSAVQILINTGTGFVDESSNRSNFSHVTGLNFSHYDTVNAVDINADGFTDILLYRGQGGADGAATTRILLNDGQGVFNEMPYPLGIPDGQLIAIDPLAGHYALIETINLGFDPSTGFNHYSSKVDSVRFDWSLGNDFTTGAALVNTAQLVSDIPGRWIHGTNDNNNIVLSTGDERAFAYGGDDTISGGSGNNTIDGGAGVDTSVYARGLSQYTISRNTDETITVKGPSLTDQLTNIERLKFSDGYVALDVGATQSAGETQMLLGAVLGKDLLATKQPLIGAVIDLFDHAYTLQQLSGAVMRLPIWDVLTGKAAPTNADIANYLLWRVNGVTPDATTLASAVNALDAQPDINHNQGDFLWHLAESSANQAQVELVGLVSTGLGFTI